MKRIVILINFFFICGTAYAFDAFVVAAAKGAGANGTFFQTDLRMVNPASAEAQVDLTFLPSNLDNRAALPVRVSIGARESLEIDDIIGSLFAVSSGVGAIRIVSTSDLVVASRTYTPSGDSACPGTFGQFIPAVPSGEAMAKALIPGVSLSTDPVSGFRSNFGAVNPGDAQANVKVSLRDGSGAMFGTAILIVPPLGHVQQSVASLFAMPPLTTTNAFIEVDSSAPILSYVSVVDNRSGDPIFVPAQPETGLPRAGLTIIAKQWAFEPGIIEVPVGQPVTVQVRAIDVDHGISFSGVGPFTCTSEQFGQCILLPNETVTVTFTPRTKGSFAFFCTRFCGEAAGGSQGHTTMRGTLVVK